MTQQWQHAERSYHDEEFICWSYVWGTDMHQLSYDSRIECKVFPVPSLWFCQSLMVHPRYSWNNTRANKHTRYKCTDVGALSSDIWGSLLRSEWNTKGYARSVNCEDWDSFLHESVSDTLVQKAATKDLVMKCEDCMNTELNCVLSRLLSLEIELSLDQLPMSAKRITVSTPSKLKVTLIAYLNKPWWSPDIRRFRGFETLEDDVCFSRNRRLRVMWVHGSQNEANTTLQKFHKAAIIA